MSDAGTSTQRGALEIYGCRGWGSMIVEAACELLGEPYTLQEVDPSLPSSPALDALRARNPLAQIPTVVLPDGVVMTESAAIVLWLLERHPGSDLAPPPGDARRPAFLRWLVFFVGAIYPMVTLGDYPERWVQGEEAQGELKEATIQRTLACWRMLEEGLAPGAFLLGERMTLLDVYAAAMSRWRPGRERIRAVAPRTVAAAERAEAHPVLARVFARNFAELAGIGAMLQPSPEGARILRVIAGSPAERAGLRQGDRFVRIDGADVTGMAISDCAQRLRGAPGTRVDLAMDREGQTIELTIVREVVVL